MRAVDLIAKKRDGNEMTDEELRFLIDGYTTGAIPDYQMSAWLMASLLRGLTRAETASITMAMARSGELLDLSSLGRVIADKHSTGGVGDKTTLVLGPLVASAGLAVGKMSGRGLSFTGGTLDKLESIPGFSVAMSRGQFIDQLKRIGLVVASQTADLAPADGKLYALRDVTATVPSIPLIAASVMSKKIASGASVIVLDVKVGQGAFMKTDEDAVLLAKTMVELGESVGRKVSAVISSMDQPLGHAVGNALEVREAIDTLKRQGPADFLNLCLAVGAQMLVLSGACADASEGKAQLLANLISGRALSKFREWVAAQGGDPAVADKPDLLPKAKLAQDLVAGQAGYVAAIDAESLGLAVVDLGGGRAKKGDVVDPAVGLVLRAKVGDKVEAGTPLVTIHANDLARLAEAKERVADAYRLSTTPPAKPQLIHRIL